MTTNLHGAVESMRASADFPPLTRIASALRETTEFLAHYVSASNDEAPRWTEFEWHIAQAVAAMHGVSSLLQATLRSIGPESWQRFIRDQKDHSVRRYLQITHLLDAIDSQARRNGVGIVALKGAALYAWKMYSPGVRPMGDIDLLVRYDDAQAIARVLAACGYAASFTTHRHQVYEPSVRRPITAVRLGEHADNPIKIEVHTRVAENLPVSSADITPFLITGAAHPGINPYPTAASLMMHLLLHAAGNMRARALRLIQLHDIALLAQRLGPGDWDGLQWWAWPPLLLTARYYPGAIPTELFARLECECPWLLTKLARRQQLTQVSWSNIRVQAFPGLEWSRTPREALEFLSSRIWPSRESLAELKEGAAQIPGSATIPWYGISHGARILRWVFSRPPRVQTLLSVRAALAQTYDDSVIHAAQ